MNRSLPLRALLLVALAALSLLMLRAWSPFGHELGREAVSANSRAVPNPEGFSAPRQQAPDGGSVGEEHEASERSAVGPPSDATAPEQLTTLRLLDAAGEPVAGARVLVARGESLLLDELTDGHGEVELAADLRPVALVVRVVNRPPELHELRLEAGTVELRLLDGARVAGHLQTADGLPVEGLRLRLDADHLLSTGADIPRVLLDELGRYARSVGLARTTTDASGSFEFSGLTRDWSGGLHLPAGWRVLSASVGGLEPHGRGVRLPGPAPELLVRVVPERSLRGRLVLRAGGEPLAGAALSARVSSSDGSAAHYTNATSDEDGRFELGVGQALVGSLDLHLGASFQRSESILLLEGEALPTDGDLGDVLVERVRHVPFLLLDPEGAAVRGGTAIAAGTRSAPTDSQGRGELRWLARTVRSLRVEADGFVPAERELPEVLVPPLTIILQPANRLEVQLRVPAGGAPEMFKVVLSGEGTITACSVADRVQQRAHVGGWAYPPVELMNAPLDSYLAAEPDSTDGLAVFRALEPGVEFELEVQGLTGGVVFHRETLAPLGEAELRRHEVALAEGIVSFRGRILDQQANPLPRASLQLGNHILGWADEEGRFLCFVAPDERGTLLVQHPACATRYIHDYAVPSDGRAVEFRLNPARRVEVEVLDEAGAPVPQASVWVEYQGFTSNTHRLEGNRYVIRSAPEDSFVVIARLAGRDYRVEHDPLEPTARVVVPVHGRLVVRLDDRATSGRDGEFEVQLLPRDDSGAPLDRSHKSAAKLRIEFPAVLPGDYEAVVSYLPSDAELEAGGLAEESSPVGVTIVAGVQSELSLEL